MAEKVLKKAMKARNLTNKGSKVLNILPIKDKANKKVAFGPYNGAIGRSLAKGQILKLSSWAVRCNAIRKPNSCRFLP